MYYPTLVRKPRLGKSRRNNRGILHDRFKSLGYGYGGADINWNQVLQTAIPAAASVAKVAVTPPTYSSVVNPSTGYSSVTSYGAAPAGGLANPLAASSLTGLLTSPLILLLGGGLILVMALRR